ncbi:MAG TPA: EamA family transporter [Thermotogota bacterium]|nr:EamA family transporter [Thermotogota bacterium]
MSEKKIICKKMKINAEFFIIAAAILWGTTGSAQAFAPESASPVSVAAARGVIGGITLFLIALFKGEFKTVHRMNKKLILISAIFTASYQPLFFSGVSRTGIAFGTILAIGSAPLFAGVFDLLHGNKPPLKWFYATLISILGCVLLFSGRDALKFDSIGALCSLGAGFTYAGYSTFSRKLFKVYSRTAVNGIVMGINALFLLPLLLLSDTAWLFTTNGLFVSLHLGLITTALAYSLFAFGIPKLSAPKAVTLTLAEPLTAATLGMIVFNERLSVISIMGMILLLLGLLYNSLPELKKANT